MPTLEQIAEYAMLLYAEQGYAPARIADLIERRFGQRVSAATVAGWRSAAYPQDWEEWKSRYKTRVVKQHIDRFSEQAYETRQEAYKTLDTLRRLLHRDLLRYASGELQIQWKNPGDIAASLVKVNQAMEAMFGDPAALTQALLSALSDEERAELAELYDQEEGLEPVPAVPAPVEAA